MKKHNFYAGPAILPQFTLENTAKAVLELDNIGLSLLEISHRSKEFEAIMNEAVALFKELLDIPAGYHVLFLGGGASMQFCMIPFNLLNKKAAYLNTGVWANKAIKEAMGFGEVIEVATSKDKNFSYIPRGYKVPADVDYFHITTNNTIFGTQIHTDMDSPVSLVADMSSDIFSRPVDVSKYDLIYGGAQKNLAPAGVTFVVIKEDILGKVDRHIPTIMDYRKHIANGSMLNTPPCLPIYSALQTMKWIKNSGGITEMVRRNEKKAEILYNEIERNRLFKTTVTEKRDRSFMNICFVMNEEYMEVEKQFLDFATNRNMIGIKGHRDVGGFRASTYNAMDKESVIALVDVMKEFEKSI